MIYEILNVKCIFRFGAHVFFMEYIYRSTRLGALTFQVMDDLFNLGQFYLTTVLPYERKVFNPLRDTL